MRGPTDRSTLLERQRLGRATWEGMVARTSPEARRPDGWTLKDVVAHVGAWERAAARRLRRRSEGKPDEPPEEEDEFNARVRRESAARSWEEVLEDERGAYREFIAAAEAVPDDVLFADGAPAADIIGANGYEHYEEHLSDFPRARLREGPG